MKVFRFLLTLVIGLFVFAAQAQPSVEPAVWSQKFSKAEVRIDEVIEIIFTAPLKEHHHIYSNDFDYEDCGPLKTKISYQPTDIEVIGSPVPINPRFYVDEIWEMVCGEGKVADFEGTAEFRQKLKITGNNPSISGAIDYQICNDAGCLGYKHEFSLAGLRVLEEITEQPNGTDNTDPDETQVSNTNPDTPEDTSNSESSSTDTANEGDETAEVDEPTDENDVAGKSLWALFLLGLGGGLLALFTPCVFPMIPMTVAFFTKEKDKAKGRRMAMFYGLSIVAIYIILGMLLAMVFGATFAYTLSTHWLPNIVFFLIFILFAVSFLGMFEITLPSSFVNKMDAQGDRGGYVGVFFIAFTLVLVSFSCTAPIVGSVSILASSGEIMKPLAAMLGFSLMFAIPFTLFAIFPQWLNGLPQSGGWLNSVKVFLGFAELALAFKFLSQADLVYHWGILDRDVFISIWIVLAILLGAYFLGKITFPHDSPIDRLPVPRFLLAVAAFSFGVYLIPGLWGAPLKPLSGILPPLTTQDYQIVQGGITAHAEEDNSDIRYSDILHLPHGLTGYFIYEDALAASREQGKPVFVDFTGHSCANCRKMEEYVWVKPEVLKRLENDFIIASLYVDERKVLPEDEWYKNPDGDMLTTLGEHNADLQINTFNSNGQPYYYIVNADGEILNIGGGYDPDETKFIEFLDKGKEKYHGS
ncbi:MAG: thioredoxin family protein [Bacteroidia bacterium]